MARWNPALAGFREVLVLPDGRININNSSSKTPFMMIRVVPKEYE